MNTSRCPIAPGRGCACCDEVDDAVRGALRSEFRRWALAVVIVLAAGVVALSLSAA